MYKDIKILNNNEKGKEKKNSLSQKRKNISNTNNNSINSNFVRFKRIFISKNKNKKTIFSQKYKDLSSCRSQSKIIRKYDNSFNNSIKLDKKGNGIMSSYEQLDIKKNKNKQYQGLKTVDNKKNDDISFDKDISSMRPKISQITKNNSKNKDNNTNNMNYQKSIINKIIFNSINNERNNNKKKNKINEKGRKLVFKKFKMNNKLENKFNNYTFGV